MFKRLFLLLVVSLAAVLPGQAQFNPAELVQARLITNTPKIEPGKPFQVGFHLKLKQGWHTYWAFSGDTGYWEDQETKQVHEMISAEWKLPPGFKAGPLVYPLPHQHLIKSYDFLSYIYEPETVIFATITPPAELPSGEITLAATLGWLACEKTCIPGKSPVELKVNGSTTPSAEESKLWTDWQAQLPQEGQTVAAQWNLQDPKQVEVQLTGLPKEAKVEFYPLPPLLPPTKLVLGHPVLSEPDTNGARKVTMTLQDPVPAGSVWRGLAVWELPGQPRQGAWVAASDANQAVTATPAAGAQPAVSAAKPAGAAAPTLLVILGLAFVGGLILNVMPCVLPVIALKIFSFVRQAGEDPKQVFRLGLAFVAGVFAFFLLLAVAVIALKSTGRTFSFGYPLQNPYLLSGLISLVFLFGLNMAGLFEVTLGSGATSTLSQLSRKEGYGGAFLHGMFTTLLGTSCTAPFLASALGATLTQPAPAVLLIFLCIAAGMSLPYFLLTAKPAWLKFLPKPGVWMDRVKQALGFIMLGVAVWLLTVFAENFTGTASALLWFLLALGFAGWLFGTLEHRGAAGASAVAIIALAYFFTLHPALRAEMTRDASTSLASQTHAGGIPWQKFAEPSLEAARKENKTVFIDFTANWCLNCKIYERTVIETAPVQQAFAKHGIVPLKADWSRNDPEITKWLNKFGRVGVPLYVVYRPGESEPQLMDGLTQEGLLEALRVPRP